MITKNNTVILDGAMGTQLRARGIQVPDYKSSIWSALALIEAKDAVRMLHMDYIEAGADVITANNYAVTRKLLARENLESKFADLTVTAAKLAQQARDICKKPTVRIAGSVAPLNTSYRGDLVDDFDDNLAAYRETVSLLAPHVDILLCETMSTTWEARAAATAAAETGKTVWVSWTLAPEGGMLRSGESLQRALAAVADLPVEAVFFNCSSGNAIDKSLPEMMSLANVPVGVYANPVHHEPPGGEPETVPTLPLSPDEYADMALSWIDSGARLIGGCCDTSPAHIARLRSRITEEFA